MQAFWTGRRFYVALSRTQQFAFSPETNSWNPLVGELPFEPHGRNESVVTLPERRTTFVWAASEDSRAAPSNASYLFVDNDDVHAGWTAVTTSGAPSPRRLVAAAREGDRVYVMFGQQGIYDGTPGSVQGRNDGGVYNLTTGEWAPVPSEPLGCNGNARTYHPIAIANGVLATNVGGYGAGVLPCDGTARLLTLGTGVWTSGDATVGTRIRHRWLAVNGRFVLIGGAVGGANDSTPAYNDTAVVTSTGHVSAGVGPLSQGAQHGYALATGRAALMFSGVTTYSGGEMVNGGAIGVVDDQAITWTLLPSSGAPSNRMLVGPGDSYSLGNQQSQWTGREALVFGGVVRTTGSGTSWVNGGAGYQPPAGCACPTSAPGDGTCVGVTQVAATTCTP